MALNYWNIFENTSLLFRDNTAVILLEKGVYETYSYGQLFEITNELYIILSETTTAGEIIGIIINHNVLVPVLLAVIHRCGCSFIFLDTTEQENQQMATISELNISTIFSITNIPSYNGFICKEVQCIETNLNSKLFLWTKNNQQPNIACINNFAYFIKTSGSTSSAKNVAVTHQSIFPNIQDFEKIFNAKATDVIYFSTPLTFDPSIIEIYLSAYCGAALLISMPYSNIIFPKKCLYPVTIWQTTPSKFLQLGSDEIQNSILNSTSQLKVLALGGEPFFIHRMLSKLKHKDNQTNIFNLYGITEVSCWSSVNKIDFVNCNEITDISIGHPLSHSLLQIMDDNFKPIIIGTGKIYIGSSTRKCLVGKEATEHTSDKCLQVLESKEILWRNTGDIGEIKNTGLLYFKGRNDSVIKRFGSKISLLEIESIGLNFQGIEQCTCLWHTDSNTLTMFFSTKLIDIKTEFLLYLRKSLAAIQMPDDVIQLKKIPITSHGKVCKKKILDTYNRMNKNNDQYIDTKDLLYDLLTEALLIEDLRSKQNESFIGLGGNSIMAIQLANKFEKYTKKHYADLFPSLLNDATPISCLFDLLMCSYTDIKPIDTMSNIINNSIFRKDDNISMPEPQTKKKRKLVYPKIVLDPSSVDHISYSLEIAWKIDLSKCIDASPVLYKIRETTYLIVGSHSGKIAIIDAMSGSVVHILDVISRVEAPVSCFMNNHSEPCAVVGDYSGCLWCFSILDGKVLWKVSLDAMIKSQACCANSNVYIASYKGVVTELDEMNGQIISSIFIGNSGITADLLLSKLGLVFVATLNGTCACLETNNGAIRIKWTHNLSSPVFAKPVFLDNETKVVFSEVNGVLHCLDSSLGNKIWTFTTTGLVFSSCSVLLLMEREYLVFGCHDSHTYQLALGKKQKPVIEHKIKQTSEVYATPCLLKNIGIISVSTEGNLQIIDYQSGNINALYNLPGKVFSSPATLDDLVYAGCRDNYVYCLRIVDKKINNE